MPLKVNIDGIVKCYCEGDADECQKILNRLKIHHSLDGSTVKIHGSIAITPYFDREGFHNHLNKQLKRHGDVTIAIKM